MGPYGMCLRSAALVCIPFSLSAADFTTYVADAQDFRIARVIAGLVCGANTTAPATRVVIA